MLYTNSFRLLLLTSILFHKPNERELHLHLAAKAHANAVQAGRHGLPGKHTRRQMGVAFYRYLARLHDAGPLLLGEGPKARTL